MTAACLCATLLVPQLCRGADNLLYTPTATQADRAPASPDEGVLVRRVTVRRGDTLKKLSRKYLGRGSWFPQVLVFNDIRNPDLIHTGATLKIPVPPGQAARSGPSRPDQHKASRSGIHQVGEPAAARSSVAGPTEPGTAAPETPKQPAGSLPGHEAAPGPAPQVPAPSPDAAGEEAVYRQANAAYLKGDFQEALTLFTLFLHRFPRSSSAADAALHRADCLLHLSAQ